MNPKSLAEAANEYFMTQMENIFVDRTVAIETFEQYLNHRYRNNCYNYSATALMGMMPTDELVRGEIRTDNSWQWENGGYGHGWLEFTYQGEIFVFDSMIKGIMPKAEWYEKAQPKKIVKFTKQEILNLLLVPEKVKLRSDGSYEVNDIFNYDDKDNIENPFQKAIIYMQGKDVHRFIAFRFFCN